MDDSGRGSVHFLHHRVDSNHSSRDVTCVWDLNWVVELPNPHSSASLQTSYFLKGLFICVDPETWAVITDAADEPGVTLSVLTAPSPYVPLSFT